MKVAIVGLAPSTRHLVPDDFETWALPWDAEYCSRASRLFEMHDRGLLETEGSLRTQSYWDRLRDVRVPVYMQQKWDDIPKSTPFPFESLQQTVFKNFHRARWDDQVDWYNSSPAYMLALAIHEGATTIGLYGIDVLDDSEFNYESNCLDYLIGKAEGMGIEIVTPQGPTALGKFRGEGIKLGKLQPVYKQRYGYI